MQTYPLVQNSTYEWTYMWHQLSLDPVNQGLDNPQAAPHPTSGECWQYMSSFYLQSDQPTPYGVSLMHQFRHRQHPTTGYREIRNIPASLSYFYHLHTPKQPNQLLLIEWLRALRGNYVPQCIKLYGNGEGFYCASGLLLHIAGLINGGGTIDLHIFEQALRENHPPIGKMLCWLLDLPYTLTLDTHLQSIQQRNDRPTPFPELADHLLTNPDIQARYQEILHTHPFLTPKTDSDESAFDTWMQQVDRYLIARIGFSSEDIEDQCWYQYYEDGLTPTEAVDAALEELEYN